MNLNKFEKLVNKLGLEQNLKKIVLNKTHIPIIDKFFKKIKNVISSW